MSKEILNNHVLVVQARLPGAIEREQENLNPTIRMAGKEPFYVDALNNNVDEIYQKYQFEEVLFTGSSDANISKINEGDEPARRYLKNTTALIKRVLSGKENIRALGFCFGHQAIAYVADKIHNPYSESIIQKTNEEIGTFPVFLNDEAKRNRLFENVKKSPEDELNNILMVFGHHDSITWLPPQSNILGITDLDAFSILDYTHARTITFQGHPELNGDNVQAAADAGGYKGSFSPSDNTEQIIVNFLQS